jgi:ABC-type transport system involved in multi-copper enzyme maturation permease subunit
MIWLAWRQFRVQALATGAALVLLALYLVLLGLQIRHSYDSGAADCLGGSCGGGGPLEARSSQSGLVKEYGTQVTALGALLFGVPALIGLFWGAPLVAREFEEGTHRLVWNQSVTRTRWLAVKLALIGVTALVVTGLFSLLLTWSTSRFDQVADDRFAALTFGARGLAPIGYAVFAFVLATVAGLILRRTIPAMVLTLAVFAVVQLLVPNVIRSHYLPPATTDVAFDTEARNNSLGLDTSGPTAFIGGYSRPGTWALSDSSAILTANGTPVTGSTLRECMRPAGGPQAKDACMNQLGLHFGYSYQPANRYWPFQWIELAIFLLLSAAVTVAGFRLIRNRAS